MVNIKFTEEEIFSLLSEIPDPEIPVINISELGVLRRVQLNEDSVEIFITPTYSGCPAMNQIEQDIYLKLKSEGITNAKVILVYDPAWTTDWMTNAGKEKLKAYGIAPPMAQARMDKMLFEEHPSVSCPLCGSKNTELLSEFGSTACKSLMRCLDCREPFDYFKCH